GDEPEECERVLLGFGSPLTHPGHSGIGRQGGKLDPTTRWRQVDRRPAGRVNPVSRFIYHSVEDPACPIRSPAAPSSGPPVLPLPAWPCPRPSPPSPPLPVPSRPRPFAAPASRGSAPSAPETGSVPSTVPS